MAAQPEEDLPSLLQQADEAKLHERFTQAEEFYRRVLTFLERSGAKDSKKWAHTQHELGLMLLKSMKLEMAELALRRALRVMKQEFGPTSVDVGIILRDLGEVLAARRQVREADATLQEALNIQMAAFGPEDIEVARTLHTIGHASYEAGRYDVAEEMLEKALLMKETVVGKECVEFAMTLGALGRTRLAQGRLSEAEEHQRRALEITKACVGDTDTAVAACLSSVGETLWGMGRYEEASRLFVQASEMYLNAFGEDSPAVATEYQNEAMCLLSLSESTDKAEEKARKALAIKKKHHDDNSPHVAQSLGLVALTLQKQGKFGEAERLSRHALEMLQKSVGPETLEWAKALNVSADVHRAMGKSTVAVEEVRTALSILLEKLAFPPEQNDVQRSRMLLSMCLMDVRQFDEAEREIDVVVSVRKETVGAKHPHTLEALKAYGTILVKAEKFDAAIQKLEEARSLAKLLFGEGDPEVAYVMVNLAFALKGLGYVERAEHTLFDAVEMTSKAVGAEALRTQELNVVMGKFLMACKRFEEATSWFEKNVAMRDHKFGPFDQRTQESQRLVRDCHLVQAEEEGKEEEKKKKDGKKKCVIQ